MRNFLKLASGVNVGPLVLELARQPELWNSNGFRREFDGTPFGDCDDIWLRFNRAPKEYDKFIDSETTEIEWYPAAKKLGSLKALVLGLMGMVGGYSLERLLISRLKPDGKILPHADDKGAYTNRAGVGRYHLVLQGLSGSYFTCGNETVEMLTGEVWWFNAHEVHSVHNCSRDDRVHLLVDCLCWTGE